MCRLSSLRNAHAGLLWLNGRFTKKKLCSQLISTVSRLFEGRMSVIQCKKNIFRFGVKQMPGRKNRRFQPISRRITVCAVATSSCISDVPNQWEDRNFDPHSSHIFQPISMKLETKKDILDTTPQANRA